MSTLLNIRMLARYIKDIEKESSEAIEILNRALPALLKDQNIIISRDVFSEEQWTMLLETFGDFSKEIRKLAELLSRFAVDAEEGTFTIIGNQNVIEIG